MSDSVEKGCGGLTHGSGVLRPVGSGDLIPPATRPLHDLRDIQRSQLSISQ
jgi:hypothetical protein